MASSQVCYLVSASYAENAEQARAPHRGKHLDRLSKLWEEGALLFAGAAEDLSASYLVFAVENEEAVKAVVETDIYMRNGVWTGFTVTKVNRVLFDG